MAIELSSEQAAAIGKVLESADGYCSNCAADLAEGMAEICPGHDWMALVGQSEADHEREAAALRIDLATINGRVVYGEGAATDGS